MQFIIADTFQDSLTDLSHQAQKRAKQAVFDFQLDPSRPSFNFHRITKSRDDHFWSARVSDDLRFVVHHRNDVYVMCYVDHHDEAYAWAERRTLQQHPKTGSLQFVEVETRTKEIIQRVYKQTEPPLFEECNADYLLRLGVPPIWLDAVQHASEEVFFDELAERLPEEVIERLFRLAAGEAVPVPQSAAPDNPFEHPDSRRRFHLVEDESELRQALEWPWKRWIVFLHPRQRGALEKTYNGPAFVSGGAGTGKTVVAMHRAAQLLRKNENRRVLFTTFSKTLAARLQHGMDILIGEENPAQERLHIVHLHKLARDLWTDYYERHLDIVSEKEMRELLEQAALEVGSPDVGSEFLYNEWNTIIDAWGVKDWQSYRDFSRKGRGTPLGARRRHELWQVFDRTRALLKSQGRSTWNSLCYDCVDIIERDDSACWNHIVVDETQDFGPSELQLLRSLAHDVPNNLFLVGDSGQRIYKKYFNWSDTGIHVVGRSTRLKINYRTTEQIRNFSDSLMPADLREHGGQSGRRDTVSLLEGVRPDVSGFDDPDDEITFVARRLEEMLEDGYHPRDIAIFGRVKPAVLDKRAKAAVRRAGAKFHRLDTRESDRPNAVSVGTMHAAKGLEFKAVIIMGCENDLVPLTWALDDESELADREDKYEQERNLLYVACTRAREQLLVTYTGEPSEFLGTNDS